MHTLAPAQTSSQAQALEELRFARHLYPPDPIPLMLPGGGLSLIAGATGTGKTAFLAWLATRFRDHATVFGHPSSAIPMQAFLSLDRSWVQSSSRWFEAVGFPDIASYAPLDDPEFKAASMTKGSLLPLLQTFLDRFTLPANALVYVDPLALFLGKNLLDYRECAIACMQIREICRTRQITMIGMVHTAKLKTDPKDRYTRPQDRIFGSTALLGYTDTQMYLSAPDENNTAYFQFYWKPHHAREETFNLARDPDTGLFIPVDPVSVSPGDLACVPAMAADPDRSHLVDLILTIVQQLTPPDSLAGVHWQSIVQAVSLPRTTVFRHLKRLVKGGELVEPKAGHYRRTTPQ